MNHMLISLFETPFDHIHIHPTSGLVPDFILTVCLKVSSNRVFRDFSSYYAKHVSTQRSNDVFLQGVFFTGTPHKSSKCNKVDLG